MLCVGYMQKEIFKKLIDDPIITDANIKESILKDLLEMLAKD